MQTSRLFIAAGVAALAAGSIACGSGISETRFSALDTRVTTMGQTLDQTVNHVKQDETKTAAVEQQAATAQRTADHAQQTASAAQAAAAVANTTAQSAATGVDALTRRLAFSVVLNDDENRFAINQATLPVAAKAKLDDIAKNLMAGPKRGYLDIEGYTDDTGTSSLNQQLGLERARAVMRYLNEQQHVPLWRMNVISYGEDHPVATNKTKEGRAENRRVEVKVWM